MIKNYSANKELKKMDAYYPNSDLNHIYQKHRNQIVVLLSTIESIWQTKELSDQNFEILYEGLKNSWQGVYFDIIGKEINAMVDKISGIEKIISKGIKDKHWKVRFNSLVVMKIFDSGQLKNEVIDSGLNDKSKKVREMAIDIKKYYC